MSARPGSTRPADLSGSRRPELVVRAANGDVAAREGTRITGRNVPGTLAIDCLHDGDATSIGGYRPED